MRSDVGLATETVLMSAWTPPCFRVCLGRVGSNRPPAALQVHRQEVLGRAAGAESSKALLVWTERVSDVGKAGLRTCPFATC